MLAISLMTQIEEAVAGGTKQLSGNIASLDRLLSPESLRILEERHDGLFAFLAFHPGVDKSIAKYVREGTLSSDSGPKIMTLFVLDKKARRATTVNEQSLAEVGVELDTTVHPAYEVVRFLFESKVPPPLPGIAFFERFTTESDVVYVSLQGLKEVGEIHGRLGSLFNLAERAFQSSQETDHAFADELAYRVEMAKLTVYRTGRTSVRQWLVRSVQFIGRYGKDIVSLLTPFIPKPGKG